MEKLDNPMWDLILPTLVFESRWYFDSGFKVPMVPTRADGSRFPLGAYKDPALQAEYEEAHRNVMETWGKRHDHVRQFAWTITAPHTIEFVSRNSGHHVVDPMAGSGYWAYLLRQAGHRVTAADVSPGNNIWAEKCWTVMDTRDARATAYQAGPNATMLLAWPLYSAPIGLQTIRAFRGNRLIYIGEGEGGCCGDDAMFAELERSWREVDCHKPAQWEGIHDYVTVYKRVRRFGRK